MPQGIATVIPGATIEASWGNAVADRVVGRFATTAERDAAITTPTAGMLCYVTAAGGLMLYHAGAWILGGATRRGCVVSHTGQSIASGATAQMAWNVENLDPDGYHATNAVALVVPAGLGGVYVMNANIAGPATSALIDVVLQLNSATLAVNFIPIGKQNITVEVTADLAAAASVTCQIYNGHNASAFFTGTMRMLRTGP